VWLEGRQRWIATILAAVLLLLGNATSTHAELPNQDLPSYSVHPVGWIRKVDSKTYIEIDRRYLPALMGVEKLKSIWVLYWFDRNDTPEKRATLQVHPRGNPDNPLRGVFATRSPLRPNLIALSQVNILGIKDNVIEIDDIDAFGNTPVLDLKP
jgi:tRNA-Thr(GGU) m(6)t(6)A37 methyltransferase TsaA